MKKTERSMSDNDILATIKSGERLSFFFVITSKTTRFKTMIRQKHPENIRILLSDKTGGCDISEIVDTFKTEQTNTVHNMTL